MDKVLNVTPAESIDDLDTRSGDTHEVAAAPKQKVAEADDIPWSSDDEDDDESVSFFKRMAADDD